MNRILSALLIAFIGFSFSAFADVSVKGYHKKDGTYVQPHYRSSPNNTTRDNYSTYGNTNPYTGERGTKRQNRGLLQDNSTYKGQLYNGRWAPTHIGNTTYYND